MSTMIEQETIAQETFVREMEKRVRRLDQEFEQLVRRADSAERTAREKLAGMKSDFTTRKEHLYGRLDELRRAGDNARKELAAGVETAWNDLSDAFNRARSEFVTRS
jgi:molecular chaperone GrpE (heat shock protein)